MNILQLPMDEVHPYGNNPRKNDNAVEAVAASIKQYGFLVPLVISREHEIIAGHTRWMIRGRSLWAGTAVRGLAWCTARTRSVSWKAVIWNERYFP